MSNIKQAKEIVSKELSLPASKLVGGTVADNAGTLEGTDLQLMYSEGYVNGTAKNTSEVLAGTTTIAPTWVDGTNYVKKVKDGSWVAVENAPMFGTLPDFFTGREAYKGGKWYGESTSVGSTVDSHDPFSDGSGVALYKLDGDATDESGNYDGNANNVTYSTGKFGQAGVFNGSSSAISLPSSLNTARQNFSVSFWGKGVDNILPFYQDCNTTIRLSSTSAILIFTNRNGTGGYTRITPPSIDFSFFRHVCVTSDNKLFIDGVETTASITTSSTTVNFNFSNIGKAADGAGQEHLNGSIDQVRIFDRELTVSEVTTLYNEELPLFTELPPQTYLPYTVEATSGSVTAVNEWKYPDLVTETFATNSLQMNGLEAYACRAWVNFDGTRDVDGNSSTANTERFIRSSGNVARVVRNGTGDYTVVFTNLMPDVNYATVEGGGRNESGLITNKTSVYSFLTTSFKIKTHDSGSGVIDHEIITASIFR